MVTMVNAMDPNASLESIGGQSENYIFQHGLLSEPNGSMTDGNREEKIRPEKHSCATTVYSRTAKHKKVGI